MKLTIGIKCLDENSISKSKKLIQYASESAMQKKILVGHRVAIKIFETSGAPPFSHIPKATTVEKPKHASSVELRSTM